MPSTIDILIVMSKSGAAGVASTQVVQGVRFAVSQLDQQDFLGSSKVVLDVNADEPSVNRATQLFMGVVHSRLPAPSSDGASARSALTTRADPRAGQRAPHPAGGIARAVPCLARSAGES